MITITLNAIRNHRPCTTGWEKLLNYLGKTKADDTPFPLVTVLESNGLDDALWCCRCLPEYDSAWRLFAVWCARQVQHMMTDPRSISALDVAKRFASGEVTAEELAAARAAALAAVSAATWAAAASAAVSAAAASAAVSAADASAEAVSATVSAAPRAAAKATARESQSSAFRQLITTGTLPEVGK